MVQVLERILLCYVYLMHFALYSRVCDSQEQWEKVRVPTRTGKTGKPGKMGRHFPVREKSGNFEQTGKVREKSGETTQNTGKLRAFQKKLFVIFQ